MKKQRSTPTATAKAGAASNAAPVPAPAPPKPSRFQAFLAAGEDPLTVTLSGPTSALVRWYCGATKHREGATVDGAVFGALTRAKDAYANDSFDDAFNFVVEDVLDCMNSFRLDAHSRRGFLSVELDSQASNAVFDYAQPTGADPRDVVNAAVLAEIPHVVEQLTAGEEDDDGPGIMRDHVAAARRRRLGEEAPDVPVVLSPLPEEDRVPRPRANHGRQAAAGPPPRTLTLEFSAEALALLEAARVNDGFESIEAFVRVNLAGTVAAFCESLDSGKMTRELFAAPAAE